MGGIHIPGIKGHVFPAGHGNHRIASQRQLIADILFIADEGAAVSLKGDVHKLPFRRFLTDDDLNAVGLDIGVIILPAVIVGKIHHPAFIQGGIALNLIPLSVFVLDFIEDHKCHIGHRSGCVERNSSVRFLVDDGFIFHRADADLHVVAVLSAELFVQVPVDRGRLFSPVGIGAVADIHAGGFIAEEAAVIDFLHRAEIAAGKIVFGMGIHRGADVVIPSRRRFFLTVISRMGVEVVSRIGKRASSRGGLIHRNRQHHQRVASEFILALKENVADAIELRLGENIVVSVLVVIAEAVDHGMHAHPVFDVVIEHLRGGIRQGAVADKLIPVIPGVIGIDAVVPDAVAVVIQHDIELIIPVEIMAVIAVVRPALFEIGRRRAVVDDVCIVVIVHLRLDHVEEIAVAHRKHRHAHVHILKRHHPHIFELRLGGHTAQGKGHKLPFIIRVEICRIDAVAPVYGAFGAVGDIRISHFEFTGVIHIENRQGIFRLIHHAVFDDREIDELILDLVVYGFGLAERLVSVPVHRTGFKIDQMK